MANTYFRFKQFTVHQDKAAMKVTTDACLFGAWVAAHLQAKQPSCLLDIGTGTGLLSLMIAQQVNTRIDAVEIEEQAYRQAVENTKTSPWKEQISVHHSDIVQYTPAVNYEVVVSNPPFYENELSSPDQQKNIAHHSEQLSLEELLYAIDQNLEPAGMFYLLLPYKRKAAIEAAIRKQGLGIAGLVAVKPSVNHPFFRLMIAGVKEPVAVCREEEIAIRDAAGEYTAAFQQLLAPYYLYL